jgi:hypothetical protein
MATTTIRLADDLKLRLGAAAKRSGKSVQAFVLDAITETVDRTELEDDFHRVADERLATVLATGRTVPWDAAKAWLEARGRGERPVRPEASRPAEL